MKRTSRLVILLTVFALMLAGCGGGSGEQGSSSGEDKGKQTVLRFATWDTGEKLKVQENIAKAFEKSHTGVKVQIEPYADGFDQKLAASFGASNPPDVMLMWDFPTYHSNLEPLDAFTEKDASLKLDDIYDGLFNYVKVDGKTYGMPAGFTTRAMYYNKKVFDAMGVPYPKDGWTWDDFKDIATKLTDKSKKQYGFGVRAENDPYDLQGFIWSNGGSFISEDGKTIEGIMNGPDTVAAVQMFGNMVKDGYGVLVGGKTQLGGNDIFKAGKIGMWESGVWPLDGFKEAKVDFGTVEMPAFPGKPVKGVISVSAVSIAKQSKQKDLAWEFVKFFISEEAVKMKSDADLPIRKSVVQEMKLDTSELYAPFYRMLERSDNTPAFLLNSNWNQMNRHLSTAVDSVMLGEDAQKALDTAVKEAKKFIEKK
ncbi:sugar ABC transporter substrate-binding protein [Paenibacillus sp. MER 180]|uniref:Sugar ABC transporter substrate-binding protein n=1 Tax=Paenibacillus popilliae TaxID=78057 RepID=A0ABY3AKY6_PAEPP|nr:MULTISPECIES: sugar ABC transporter substrate-binding protein [unclassified Paenibacillus]MCM3291975.1 sugar ABC transporter substrate-binding protein [Paenibacillus sp. MER 180]TQR42168.1 sugar ABC transporter substrate-binding protein [Paenibacillus sp. SDF0028]